MKKKGFHYTQCGLDNVFLLNGYEIRKTPRGKSVVIQNLDGLHEAIGRYLVEKKHLTGKELRFLRHLLDLSQANLARLLGTQAQTVMRWEKGGTKRVDGAAKRLIRALYLEKVTGNVEVEKLLTLLNEIDKIEDEKLTLVNTNGEWKQDAA